MSDKIILTDVLLSFGNEKGRGNRNRIREKNLVIIPHNHNSQRLLDTHFSSTNDCSRIRLNVVSTGSATGLMTSNQLENERKEPESHFY